MRQGRRKRASAVSRAPDPRDREPYGFLYDPHCLHIHRLVETETAVALQGHIGPEKAHLVGGKAPSTAHALVARINSPGRRIEAALHHHQHPATNGPGNNAAAVGRPGPASFAQRGAGGTD